MSSAMSRVRWLAVVGCALILFGCESGQRFPDRHLIAGTYYLIINSHDFCAYIVSQESHGVDRMIIPLYADGFDPSRSVTRIGVVDHAVFGTIGPYGSTNEGTWFVINVESGSVKHPLSFEEAAKRVSDFTGKAPTRSDAQLLFD